MSAFSFTASTPMSPHHRRAQSPIRDIYSPTTIHSPSRLVRRLSGSAAMTPPSTSKSHRKSSEAYSECDRFIPSRAASNLEDAFERMESNDPISRQENQGSTSPSSYSWMLLLVCCHRNKVITLSVWLSRHGNSCRQTSCFVR